MKKLAVLIAVLILAGCQQAVKLQVMSGSTAKVGAKQSAATLATGETVYDPTTFYVGTLRRAADGEVVALPLYDGRALFFDDVACTVAVGVSGIYPQPQPLPGDWNGDGNLNLIDVLGWVDEILGRI